MFRNFPKREVLLSISRAIIARKIALVTYNVQEALALLSLNRLRYGIVK